MSYFDFLIIIFNSIIVLYITNSRNKNFDFYILFMFFITIITTFYFLYFNNSIDFFSKAIVGLCVVVIYVVLVSLNSKLQTSYWLVLLLYSFIIITWFICNTNNIFIIFTCYELLMIPSVLLLYNSSYALRSYSAMLYFILWTQTGSFLVFISIVYLGNIYLANLALYKISIINSNIFIFKLIKFFLFIGFGIKVPIFPFYRWLVQIHVEAPSGFSIFLSGFLVKVAVFVYYKLIIFFPYSFEYLEIFMILGIFNSSLKFWFQTDIKKVIAYATIQEMNMIFLLLNFIDQKNIFVVIIFVISHGLISTLMFYIVELIYRRFNTRSITKLSSLWYVTPMLSKIIFLKTLVFLGLPGFAKFTIEVLFFMFCFSLNFLLCLFLFISINLIGMIGYARVWLPILFLVKEKQTILKNNDITINEGVICFSLFILNILLNIFFVIYNRW